MPPEKIILVVGCHRSGTSAVTGALARLGARLADDLLPPASDNPKGFHESRAVVSYHDDLLASLGASWDRPPPRGTEVPRDDRLRDLIRAMPGPICAVKDPRACLFLFLWREACEALGVDLCVLEVRRDPEDVARSLADREGWSMDRARDLVGFYDQKIERERLRATYPWETIDFPADLFATDFAPRMIEAFGLPPQGSARDLAGFLDPGLVHQGRRPVSIVVPSRSPTNVCDFIETLIDVQPEIEDEPERIVVVSDGLPRSTKAYLKGVTWVTTKRPFVFARAINAGVKAAGGNDIVIAGDDVRFRTHGMIDRLQVLAANSAAVAPEIVGIGGFQAQRAGAKETTDRQLAFVCVFIRRAVWEAVGELDERFTGYGYDDVDWCIRAEMTEDEYGRPLGSPLFRVDHGSRVMHIDRSTYRAMPEFEDLYAENREIFADKWPHVPIEGGVTA